MQLSLVVDTSDMERKEMDLIVHGREVRAFRNFGVRVELLLEMGLKEMYEMPDPFAYKHRWWRS